MAIDTKSRDPMSMNRPPAQPSSGATPRPAAAIKFTTGKASEICERFLLSEQAALCLTDDLAPMKYIGLLMDKNLNPDAVRVLAHGLPKREAVWWACRCLREALGANLREKTKLALEAAENWSKTQTEAARRDAQRAAETAGYGTPAGLLALAVFWSGGSLTPSDAPVMPPDDDMTAVAVAGAVLLAAVGAAPEDVPKRHQRFLALGLAVASS